MPSLNWSIASLCVLLPTVLLHNWANAQRPVAARKAVRVGSRRWWLPWPRRAEFPDARSWRAARLAQILLYGWAAIAFGGALLRITASPR